MTLENEVKNAILDYLALRKDTFAWPNSSVGIYDAKRKVFRKNHSKHHMNGVADILGIHKGKPLAIEVKAGKGYPSANQKVFLKRFHQEGGLCFVAWSVEDVSKRLSQVETITPRKT